MLGSKALTREKIVAVADVDSSSASVSLLLIHPNAPAAVIASNRQFLSLEDRTPQALSSAVLSKLSEAGEKALAEFLTTAHGRTHPSAVYVFLRSAPWVRSKTLRTVTKLKEDQRITDQMIGEIARKMLNEGKDIDPSTMFESSVVRVELNGYPTSEPADKFAHEIGVIALISDCDAQFRSAVQESLTRMFPSSAPVMRSAVRAVISMMRDRLEAQSCLFVEVGTQGASFTSVREDLSIDQIFVPEGNKTILKNISETGMLEDALSMMRMVEREDCSGAQCDKVRAALARFEPELARTYGDAMAKIASPHRLPNNLLLLTHTDFAPWLAKFFSRIDFTQFTVTTQPFSVTVLGADNLARHAVAEKSGSADTGALLAAGLVNIEMSGQ